MSALHDIYGVDIPLNIQKQTKSYFLYIQPDLNFRRKITFWKCFYYFQTEKNVNTRIVSTKCSFVQRVVCPDRDIYINAMDSVKILNSQLYTTAIHD